MISRDDDQKIREKLLRSLIDHMDEKQSERMVPHKAMEVSVAAPDKDKLVEGLSKAKELMDSGELDKDSGIDSDDDSLKDSDESRLMELAGKDSEEDPEAEDEDDRRPMRRW